MDEMDVSKKSNKLHDFRIHNHSCPKKYKSFNLIITVKLWEL